LQAGASPFPTIFKAFEKKIQAREGRAEIHTPYTRCPSPPLQSGTPIHIYYICKEIVIVDMLIYS
jgi:hypothetical protein